MYILLVLKSIVFLKNRKLHFKEPRMTLGFTPRIYLDDTAERS